MSQRDIRATATHGSAHVSELLAASVETSAGLALDFIEELRLRQWARRNYVPADRRGGEWHPIVLDEMLSRDRELTPPTAAAPILPAAPDAVEMPPGIDGIGRRYVPLPPTHVSIVHQAHTMPREPNLSPAGEPRSIEWAL